MELNEPGIWKYVTKMTWLAATDSVTLYSPQVKTNDEPEDNFLR